MPLARCKYGLPHFGDRLEPPLWFVIPTIHARAGRAAGASVTGMSARGPGTGGARGATHSSAVMRPGVWRAASAIVVAQWHFLILNLA